MHKVADLCWTTFSGIPKSCTPPKVTDGDLVREMGFTKAQVKKLRKAIANLPGLLRESFAAIAPRHHRGVISAEKGIPAEKGATTARRRAQAAAAALPGPQGST